jgi:hypothetical protein
MNLKPTIVAFTLILFSISAFGQYHYIQKLASFATIVLPDTPKLVEKDGIKIYVVKYQGVIFMGQSGDISPGLQDYFKKNDLDTIYNVYVKGMLGGVKGKLFYKNKLKINGHDGIEFGYKSKVNGQLTFSYHHAVALNDTILMCGIWSSDSLSKHHKNLAAFFKGFKIKDDAQLSTAYAEELGRKTGKTIAILICISIPIIIGFGLIFIIRKIVYRKKE